MPVLPSDIDGAVTGPLMVGFSLMNYYAKQMTRHFQVHQPDLTPNTCPHEPLNGSETTSRAILTGSSWTNLFWRIIQIVSSA